MWMIVFYNHQISPGGRAGGFHMLRCQWLEVNHYDFTLGRLAYESLQLVLDPGSKSLMVESRV